MPARNVLSGDLSAFGLAEIFSLIAMGKKSGTLRLTRGAEMRTLLWDNGEIVFARSNSVRASLGNFLVRKGIITPEQNAISASKIDDRTRHGKVLVRMGFITADQLLWAVKQQVLEIIYSMFEWQTGFFEFIEGVAEDQERITLSISTTKIVMEGIHRVDQWSKIRATIPDNSIVLEPSSRPAEVSAATDLSSEEKKVYGLIDGKRTVEEVVEHARLGEFDSLEAVVSLLGRHFIRRARSAARAARAAN